MDALELLKSDHDKVNGIFQQFERGGGTQEFQQLFNQLNQELSVHAQIEEQIFYPAVRNHPDTSNLVKEAYQEHAQVKQLLSQISGLDNTTQEWGDKMTTLMHDVQHHVQEEEGELFPKVREHMGADQLNQLGQQMQQAKQSMQQNLSGMGTFNTPTYDTGAQDQSMMS